MFYLTHLYIICLLQSSESGLDFNPHSSHSEMAEGTVDVVDVAEDVVVVDSEDEDVLDEVVDEEDGDGTIEDVTQLQVG